ncbi:hypothetical protein SLEP1_g39684 [Rubroshorea leprosula]|uniref:Uncharacterized protein n=1 Tax=Rubroshorea leprosula TaxID=152421 RepID=A0AAV5L1C8_9ROSI|nr:hypothetical protein SLEP1_g39684 [Rubroshorea leprosula]
MGKNGTEEKLKKLWARQLLKLQLLLWKIMGFLVEMMNY